MNLPSMTGGYIGTIKVADNGRAVAFDRDGKHLGSFPSFKAASAAFGPSVERPACQP